MSVHNQISRKVNEKLTAIEEYKQLDNQREILIIEAIKKYQSSNYVELTKLNELTKEMNQLASKHQFPHRKIVSKEMFLEYVTKQH